MAEHSITLGRGRQHDGGFLEIVKNEKRKKHRDKVLSVFNL
jgi:hypothetical protein